MPTITITNLYNREIFSEDTEKSVLQLIHENEIDWMHACGGKGRCTSCKMIVEEGMEQMSEISSPEKRYRNQGRLRTNERLCCQTTIKGDIKIRVAKVNKFPHIDYSN
ncbi:hypothetical protein GCM10027429_06060 [Marivirga atlantica]|jgi:2Fe-2S ferredoxin|uniref:(2Fe-2S)-binding protein n=1 Tax=Marivirga atlantica TaxID=1548457 RepID=A0A937A8C5_9BACT|nr:2Fe-2S iron-sulfur cluster-binding protein [Marivirga atlantica]MBL0764216.1 (2Fe-2S)-binding protein [Marivirga atlantica]